jgi:hypothetical protein
MTKDDLLVQLRAAKSSFVLGLASVYLLAQKETHILLNVELGNWQTMKYLSNKLPNR